MRAWTNLGISLANLAGAGAQAWLAGEARAEIAPHVCAAQHVGAVPRECRRLPVLSLTLCLLLLLLRLPVCRARLRGIGALLRAGSGAQPAGQRRWAGAGVNLRGGQGRPAVGGWAARHAAAACGFVLQFPVPLAASCAPWSPDRAASPPPPHSLGVPAHLPDVCGAGGTAGRCRLGGLGGAAGGPAARVAAALVARGVSSNDPGGRSSS